MQNKSLKKAEEQLGVGRGGAPCIICDLSPPAAQISAVTATQQPNARSSSPHFTHCNTECKTQHKTRKFTDKTHYIQRGTRSQ